MAAGKAKGKAKGQAQKKGGEARSNDQSDGEQEEQPGNSSLRDRLKARRFRELWDTIPAYIQDVYTKAATNKKQ